MTKNRNKSNQSNKAPAVEVTPPAVEVTPPAVEVTPPAVVEVYAVFNGYIEKLPKISKDSGTKKAFRMNIESDPFPILVDGAYNRQWSLAIGSALHVKKATFKTNDGKVIAYLESGDDFKYWHFYNADGNLISIIESECTNAAELPRIGFEKAAKNSLSALFPELRKMGVTTTTNRTKILARIATLTARIITLEGKIAGLQTNIETALIIADSCVVGSDAELAALKTAEKRRSELWKAQDNLDEAQTEKTELSEKLESLPVEEKSGVVETPKTKRNMADFLTRPKAPAVEVTPPAVVEAPAV